MGALAFAEYSGFLGISGRLFNSYSISHKAVWASAGPAQSTGLIAQPIQSVAPGSVHHYEISFDGANWNIYFDGTLVKQIQFPHVADYIEICYETSCLEPNDPGQINAGVVSFSNMNLRPDMEGATSYDYGVSGYNGVRNNGLAFFGATGVVQMGWGLPIIEDRGCIALSVGAACIPAPVYLENGTGFTLEPQTLAGLAILGGAIVLGGAILLQGRKK